MNELLAKNETKNILKAGDIDKGFEVAKEKFFVG